MAKDNSQANDAVSKALNMLKRIRRLEGTALISGGVLLHEDCPRGADTRLFSQSVVHLFDGLEEKGDYADEIHLSFDGGDVLLMFRYPVILCIFFERGGDLASIEKGGNQFLNQFGSALGIQNSRPRRDSIAPATVNTAPQNAVEADAAPAEPQPSDESVWVEYRRQIEILFTKVLGSAQASRIINRELSAMGVTDTGFLRKSQYRPFGQKLTSRIKDKAIRRQIEDELVAIVDSLT